MTALAGPESVVEIPKLCQKPKQADYEGELCVIIGKSGKNISKEDALSYVAGYCCGNDVSSRTWQRDKDYAGSVPQWGFSKGFDNYAPVGPQIVSSKVGVLTTLISVKIAECLLLRSSRILRYYT